MDKLVLIDGNSLLNRAYFATPVFTTKNGTPTNAIFGFVKLLLKIIDDNKPEYLIVAFDMKAPTFRHKMYDGYKANRKPMPEELAAQVEPLKALLSAMKVASYQQEGIEADDIIGTISAKFNVHSYIYTGDRDCYQLVDDKTDVCFTKRGVSDLIKLSAENFKETVGVTPAQVVDLKSLMGDSSDNIPGVPGIGEKTAVSLITQYGSLSGVYENLENLKGSVKQKLTAGKELAELSYTLAKINRECDIQIDLNDCRAPKKYDSEVKKLFAELEFKTLLTQNIFEEDDGEVLAAPHPEKVTVNCFDEITAIIKNSKDFYARLGSGEIEFYNGDKIYKTTVGESLIDEIDYSRFVEILKLIFENPNNRVVLYDCKSDMHALGEAGVSFNCAFDDISVMSYLADNRGAETDFKTVCAVNLLDYNYAAYNLKVLYDQYIQKLEEDGILKLYYDIERPLVSVLYDMESEGVAVSRDEFNKLGEIYYQKIDELTEQIYSMCGTKFNINSPSQLGDVLFNKLGLKSGKKNKRGGYSTNADVLESLADENEVVRVILKYRLYVKLYSTYIEGFKPYIERGGGRVHTNYNQTVTTTGRLSSTNPNLQNIPVREDEGREIRKMFIPRVGNVFIDADYSQIELRLLAHFSGCKELIRAYNNGEDVHAVTASQVFGVPLGEVTPKMRREAKAVNFGIIYGISEFGLAKNLNISNATAKEYIKKYFEQYSEVKSYMDANVEFAKSNGFVRTLTGRKRVINELKSSNYMVRQFGERAAMNMPLQGTSADIIKIAMVNVSRALKDANLKTKLILQVHDELVLDAPEEEAEKAAEILKYEMENAVKLNVPLTVEIHSGKNWYDTK